MNARVDVTTGELIRLEAVSKTYHLGMTEVNALHDVSFTLRRGEFTALMGPSGSGKSTLGERESVLRMPLKDLEASLDPEKFWRVHRNAIVRVAAIARVKNDLRGNHVLELKQGKRTVAVGRSYACRFRQM